MAATALKRAPVLVQHIRKPTMDDAPKLTTVPAAAKSGRSLLRFITCGSVDDGKSTLIGRLLFDSEVLLEDQMAALRKDSAKSGATNGEIDYSLLLDGLAAEREQGITIDVAYRYFSTKKRAFIVADTPGHEQYTRNMATGASTADLAIILIDARKGVLPQTRRHTQIVSMLGVRHAVLAVNKMDLVEHSESRFREIEAEFRAFAAEKGFASLVAIPISAKLGENVRGPAPSMPWYKGTSLLDVLENADVGAAKSAVSGRFVVQWVNRAGLDFRGFSGVVASGNFRPGDSVRALPSGQVAKIARIVTFDGDLDEAGQGQAPTLVLDREIDVSRGDVIVADDHTAAAARHLTADVLWMSNEPFDRTRPLLLKIGSKTVPARIDLTTISVLNIATGTRSARVNLATNDIAGLGLTTDTPVVAERYAANHELGGFILIDRDSAATVAMGMVTGIDAGRGSETWTDVNKEKAGALEGFIAPPVETWWRSIAKSISWRVTGSADTFLLAYLFTGHVRVAAAISLTEVATKIVLYTLHERLWQRIAPGRADVKKAAEH